MPANRPLRSLYRFYFRHILPRTATVISGDQTGAYRYLPTSVDTFLDADALARLMAESGLEDVRVQRLTCGVAFVCIACRP
jgi:demethylmenaquinone methyltransferase/2-methoxy-6-polyprenyl-1,4-benzoquinol methylase